MESTEMMARLAEAVEATIPFNRVLGLERFAVADDGTVSVYVPMREELIGNYTRRTLHGGVISATLDLVGGIAALYGAIGNRLPENHDEGLAVFANMGTIDLRIDYLRPGSGTGFEASAVVLRAGRRVAVTRMEMIDDRQRRIAVGTGTYIIG